MSVEDTIRKLAVSGQPSSSDVVLVWGIAQTGHTATGGWDVMMPDQSVARVGARAGTATFSAGDRVLMARTGRGSWIILDRILLPGQT